MRERVISPPHLIRADQAPQYWMIQRELSGDNIFWAHPKSCGRARHIPIPWFIALAAHISRTTITPASIRDTTPAAIRIVRLNCSMAVPRFTA